MGSSLADAPAVPAIATAVSMVAKGGSASRSGPVPESFRNQGPQTRTAKNRKKPVQTGRNWFCNKYIKMRHIPAKSGLGV